MRHPRGGTRGSSATAVRSWGSEASQQRVDWAGPQLMGGVEAGAGWGWGWFLARRKEEKVEWHPGEVYRRVGFIVTNLRRPAIFQMAEVALAREQFGRILDRIAGVAPALRAWATTLLAKNSPVPFQE